MASRLPKCLLTSKNLTIKLLTLRKANYNTCDCVKYISLRKRVIGNSQHGLHFGGCFVYLNTFF
jgi:hypothetical protein